MWLANKDVMNKKTERRKLKIMDYNYIKCGDCLELMKEIPNNTVNLVITSPPYNMTKRKGGYADTGKYDKYIDWKPESEYIEWITQVFDGLDNVLVENGVILLNFSYSIENPSLPYKLVAELVGKTNFDLADTIVWKKKNGIPFPANKCRLSRIWEFVFVFARKKEINTYITAKKVKSISEKTNQTYYEVIYNFFEAKNNDGKCSLNQATFSSEFVGKLLDMYSASEEDIVLDVFMGTGTTPYTCALKNRRYIGFEISEKQYAYACERIKGITR